MSLTARARYFFLHLACSLLVGLALLALVFLVWYPTPLASAEGVTTIFMLLLAVDVIVGPLLSLLVYKEGKKTLKMDLSIIVLVQILAMGYGAYAIAQSRPAWIVQNGSIFQLVRANAILQEDQKDAEADYQSNSWTGPKWVAVNHQHSKYERYAEQTLVPNLYTDLSIASARMQQYAQPLESLQQFNELKTIKKILDAYPEAQSWMPLRTTGIGLTVLLDQDYKVIKVVDLRPWQE